MGSIENRLKKLEVQSHQSGITWQLRDGRKVSFDWLEMFRGLTNMLHRSAEANKGQIVTPRDEVNEALLLTSSEEREKLARRHSWVCHFEVEEYLQENPEQRSSMSRSARDSGERIREDFSVREVDPL